MKVLFITNIPSPYRVDFFNEMGKQCNLTVIFEKQSSDERDYSWNNYHFKSFKGIILKGIKINTDTTISFRIKKYLKEKFDFIIVSNISSPTGIIAMNYLIKHKIPYSIEGDGGFHKSGKGLKEKIKKYFIKRAHYYFSTCQSLDDYYIFYGAKEKNIIRYPFTSMFSNEIKNDITSISEKQEIKLKNRIDYEKIVLTVGQFIPRKGIDLLIRAAKSLDDKIGIYVIGGKPTYEFEKIIDENNIKNVHFVDFTPKDKLSEFYKMADVFVLPTREDIWGLVINEAMSFGLPIISTDMCGAALELVKNDINGYIIPVNDVNKLVAAIKCVISNERKMRDFGIKSLEIIKNYTIEKMANTHIQVINKIINGD